MTRPNARPESLDDIAVRWFTRREAPNFAPDEAAELEAWLDADPAHRAAYDAVAFTWQGIEPLRADPRIRAMQQGRPRRWVARALAACLAVAVLGGGGLAGWYLWPQPTLSTQQFTTGVGEKATVTLPDGSVVTLSTDTLVRTRKDDDKRLVYLDRGQAFFTVAKDRRHPFEVHAAGRTVTAVGTAFEVRVDDGFKVTLVEGKVRVDAPLAPAPSKGPAPLAPKPQVQETVMVAGTQLVASGDIWRVQPADVARETSWTRGQLVFVDEPLANVAAEMNRFSDRKIRVDASAGATKISGTFKPGDVAAFVSALRDYGLADIASADEGEVRLSAVSPEKNPGRTGG
ncbi:MAG TPA: FecR domain-containing protein [Caulobacteraceae bacterium]